MSSKRGNLVLNRYTIILCTVIFSCLIVIIFIMIKNRGPLAVPPTAGLAQMAPGDAQFSFNAAGAPGWYQGPVDKVSLAVFRNDRACWTYIDHKTGIVDVAAELQKYQTGLTVQGYTFTPGPALPLTLQTTEHAQPYELYQYTVVGTAKAPVGYGGQEFSYTQLANGYLYIAGYCDTFDQLSTITPVLQALTFDFNK